MEGTLRADAQKIVSEERFALAIFARGKRLFGVSLRKRKK